jgi:5'-deoxynucleotidase YfbR-like HD superfamily hydrolase
MIGANGEEIWPSGGAPELATIGQSLGRIARFNGHTKHDYNVLAHSLAGAHLMPKPNGIYFLMHDTPEIACADVPTPWKTEAARKRERMLLRRIYEKHGLPWPIPEEIQDQVDQADHMILAAEAHVLEHPAVDRIWPERDVYACMLTREQLRLAPGYRNPEVSAPKFIEAFNMYKAELMESLVQHAGTA